MSQFKIGDSAGADEAYCDLLNHHKKVVQSKVVRTGDSEKNNCKCQSRFISTSFVLNKAESSVYDSELTMRVPRHNLLR